jgi:hypothetical protein
MDSSSHTDNVQKAITKLNNIKEPGWNLKPTAGNDECTDGTDIDNELEPRSTDVTLSVFNSRFPIIPFSHRPQGQYHSDGVVIL